MFGTNVTEFARMISEGKDVVSRTAVTNWMLGRQLPILDFAYRATKLYGKSLNWLIEGDQPPPDSKYKEALRAFVRRELENTGLAQTLDLSDDALLEKLADNMLQTQPQEAAVKKKKTGG